MKLSDQCREIVLESPRGSHVVYMFQGLAKPHRRSVTPCPQQAPEGLEVGNVRLRGRDVRKETTRPLLILCGMVLPPRGERQGSLRREWFHFDINHHGGLAVQIPKHPGPRGVHDRYQIIRQ